MSLFVGNISRNVRTRDLEDEFDKFGKCTVKHKVCLRTVWHSKGSYGFVEYNEEKDAEQALKELNGKPMSGLSIAIEWSKKSIRYDSAQSHRPQK